MDRHIRWAALRPDGRQPFCCRAAPRTLGPVTTASDSPSHTPGAIPRGQGGDALTVAAREMFAERGYHAVRVADIAAACGGSAATIHYHFPGRDDLLTEALRHSVRQALGLQT